MRIENRCTEISDKSNNINKFQDTLKLNGYTQQQLNNLFEHHGGTTRRRRAERRAQQHDSNEIFYLDLPYIDERTERKVKKIFQHEGVHIRLYRRSTSLLSLLRPNLNRLPNCNIDGCTINDSKKCFQRNITYHLKCIPCGNDYIGSTVRHLHQRIHDHTHTGQGSEIHQHLLNCNNGRAKVQISILNKSKDRINTRISEAVYQKKLRPTLNTRNEDGQGRILI